MDSKLNGAMQYTKTLQNLGLNFSTIGRIRCFLGITAVLTFYKSTILPLVDNNDRFQLLANADQTDKLQ